MVEQYRFQWMNESRILKETDAWTLYAPPKTDFFYNGTSGDGLAPGSTNNAPFYYTEIAGNFVLRVQVEHAFKDMFDSTSLMVMADMANWGKSCFEFTDYHTHAIVSVVTHNNESDDANGCNIDGNTVWLQIARVGNSFAFHYSTDGEQYTMSRFFPLAGSNGNEGGTASPGADRDRRGQKVQPADHRRANGNEYPPGEITRCCQRPKLCLHGGRRPACAARAGRRPENRAGTGSGRILHPRAAYRSSRLADRRRFLFEAWLQLQKRRSQNE